MRIQGPLSDFNLTRLGLPENAEISMILQAIHKKWQTIVNDSQIDTSNLAVNKALTGKALEEYLEVVKSVKLSRQVFLRTTETNPAILVLETQIKPRVDALLLRGETALKALKEETAPFFLKR